MLDSVTSSPGAFYSVLLQTLIPRPIAWVLSRNGNGTFNVAPFSFFNGVSSEPPVLMISVGRKDDDSRKDTWANIAERSDFVVHIAPAGMARAVVETSAPLPNGESEVDLARLVTVPVEGEPLPRIEGPRAAYFCGRREIIEVGEQALILGNIRRIWLDDAAVRREGGRIRVDPLALDPLARLGGQAYSGLGKIFDVERPR